MGVMADRRHRELKMEDVAKIANTYHTWRGEGGEYEDIRGFCKSVVLNDVREQGHILTPGRYVGLEIEEDDPEVFIEKMERLTDKLSQQFEESTKLDEIIKKKLKGIEYVC